MKTILAGLGVMLACAGISSAALRDNGAVYHGCVQKQEGMLRVADTCRKDERAISWNEVGPQGPAGPQGEPGPQGAKGDTGPQGPAGVVSLQSLEGTACTRHDGSAGTVAVSVGADDSIALACAGGAAADWCATNTPAVGAHMTVSCDNATHQLRYTCEAGWTDFNHNPSDGCETASPLAPIAFDGFSLTGLTALEADFGGVDTVAVQAQCDGTTDAACPGGTPSSPLPMLSVDHNMYGGAGPRAVFAAVPANELFNVTLRARVQTVTPIPITLPLGGQCNLALDTTKGTVPDVSLSYVDRVDTVNAPDGPTVPGDVTLANFESSDYAISGGFACALASSSSATIQSIVQRALTPWAQQHGLLCGAPAPVYYQWCPAS